MVISQDGIDLIKGFESYRQFPYNDAHTPPNATIGYGWMLHAGPVTQADHDAWPNGISEFDAEQKLLAHVRDAVAPLISKYVDPYCTITQNQYDALCSFLYNTGGQAMKDPKTGNLTGLGLAFLRNDLQDVPGEMCRWIFSGGKKLDGLINRRQKEAALWMKSEASNG